MFSKILIANRGEIAVRIIRACKEMGIATVAVCSQADREALHTALADECCCVGGPAPADSYLNQERIVSAALAMGAQAIHPGYGFLSENPGFADLCRKNGLVFIGPSPESMLRLGDKALLKETMSAAGLPVIPGTGVLRTVSDALAAAETIGYPVMLKARAGGGGRGIRLAQSPEELTAAFPLAVAEGEAAFGDGAVGREYVPVTLSYQGRTASFTALRDTGNTLHDPITGEPVLVVSGQIGEALTGLTQRELASPLETLAARPLPGLRLIPYHAVGNPGGLLLAMRFPGAMVGKKQQNVLVAFAAEGLGHTGMYQALTGGAL